MLSRKRRRDAPVRRLRDISLRQSSGSWFVFVIFVEAQARCQAQEEAERNDGQSSQPDEFDISTDDRKMEWTFTDDGYPYHESMPPPQVFTTGQFAGMSFVEVATNFPAQYATLCKSKSLTVEMRHYCNWVFRNQRDGLIRIEAKSESASCF